MTDHAKQLAEELGWLSAYVELMLKEKLDETDAIRQLWAKCLSLMAENERLRGSVDEMAKELHAAINEPMYSGTRQDWMNRAFAAERELEQARKEK